MWTIMADASGARVPSLQFKIDKYVLPRYEVNLNLPPTISEA